MVDPSVIKQNRVGLTWKQFKMYKFRTMKNNSHELREDLEDLNKNDESIFKIENDPRLLKALRLRNYSLDELPQFINVLKGICQLLVLDLCLMKILNYFTEKYMSRLNVFQELLASSN